MVDRNQWYPILAAIMLVIITVSAIGIFANTSKVKKGAGYGSKSNSNSNSKCGNNPPPILPPP